MAVVFQWFSSWRGLEDSCSCWPQPSTHWEGGWPCAFSTWVVASPTFIWTMPTHILKTCKSKKTTRLLLCLLEPLKRHSSSKRNYMFFTPVPDWNQLPSLECASNGTSKKRLIYERSVDLRWFSNQFLGLDRRLNSSFDTEKGRFSTRKERQYPL